MPDSHAASAEGGRQGGGRSSERAPGGGSAASREPVGSPSGALRSGILVLAGLSSLAFAQPVYDILKRSPEFFAIRGHSTGDLIALVVLLAGVPTLTLAAPAILARIVRPSWTGPAVAAAVGVLIAVIGLQALRGLPAAAGIPAAAAAGAVAVRAWVRFQAVRSFGRILSAAAVIVPALLLIDPRIRQSAAAANRSIELDPIDTGARAPIVLVIFDEWSLNSILDRTGAIDRKRMPNLAGLADRATWYPNATAAADVSELAVPTMLTGARARQGQLPTAAEHPVNLFTLLAATHDLHVVEPITSLCPPQSNLLASPRQPARERLGLLVSDLAIVWLGLTLPAPWSDRLPAVTRTWIGFGRDAPQTVAPPPDQPVRRALFHLRQTDRAAEFRRFVESIEASNGRPDLYFLHSLLPHVPWEYLPSGRRYEVSRRGVHGLQRERWDESPWPVRHHHKRYLLQVESVDRLIGELVARLESTGLLDRSLIAIAADHGVAFRPGKSRRLLDPAEPESDQLLDLASVPLLIKAPFQQQPAVDDTPVSLAGLTRRILELAGGDPGAAPLPERRSEGLTMTGKYAGDLAIPADREPWRQRRLAEQAELLGQASDPTAIGARPRLHGRPAADFPVRTGASAIRIDNAWAWDDVDPDRPVVPVLVEGRFDRRLATDQDVAVALNGVIAATPRPHAASDGGIRIAAILPEARLSAGLNTIDVFLVGETGGQVELEHVRRAPYPVYALSRNEKGRVDALVRRSSSALDASVDRFPVVRQSPDGLFGNLDGDAARSFTLQGWAIDRGDPGGIREVVAFLAGSQYGVAITDVSRPDVVDYAGSGHLHSGFLLGPPAGAVASRRFGADESLPEAFRREGVLAYAVSRRGKAIRLHFNYMPIEGRRRGRETLPTTDGRRLTVQAPGDGFDGSVDLIVNRNGTTTIEGWAADLRSGERPRQIVIYRDGEFLANLGPTRNRPDVVEHYDDPRLQGIGFRGKVPGAPAPATFSRRHRVFAVMQRGAAVELPFHTPTDAQGRGRP